MQFLKNVSCHRYSADNYWVRWMRQQLDRGAQRISQVSPAEASQVGNCQPKGEIDVSVLAKVGFINRSTEAVEANLLQLARNGAVDSGGDTVVKGDSPDYGKRTFAIYKCRP